MYQLRIQHSKYIVLCCSVYHSVATVIASLLRSFLIIFFRYLDPIFYGDYPETMRERLGEHLPEFSEKDKELLKNSLDFVGLNHYTTRFVVDAATNCEDNEFYRVQGVERIGKDAIQSLMF